MKKLMKNKVFVLVICVAVVSLVYFVARKAIDEYTFKTNGDIIREDESLNDGSDMDLDENAGDKATESGHDDSGMMDEEEVDLVLEESEEDSVGVEGDGGSGAGSDGVDSGEDAEQNKIYIYITGEVNVPGVVILNENSRIVDAINAAGGTTAKADISKVNLVYVLEDGMKINIPNSSDLKNNPDFEYITMSSGEGANDSGARGEGSSSDSGSSGGSSSSGSSGTVFSGGYSVVNINTATQTELETLPGIGPSLALKIINYRNENGKFSSVDQIKNVSGIGDAKFENMRSLITV